MQNGNRKVLLINPRFQFRFLGFMWIASALILIVIYLSNIYFFHKFNEMGMTLNLSPDHIFFQFLKKEQHMMNSIFFITGVTVVSVMTVLGLIFSHRVSGPIHRLNQHFLKNEQDSKLSLINFREEDYFQELATSFNNLVTQLEKK